MKLPQAGCNRVPRLLHNASPNMHCVREHIQRKDQKKGGTTALDGGETGEKNEKTRGGENEQGGFFRKLRKITKNRENTNRGGKKPENKDVNSVKPFN